MLVAENKTFTLRLETTALGTIDMFSSRGCALLLDAIHTIISSTPFPTEHEGEYNSNNCCIFYYC